VSIYGKDTEFSNARVGERIRELRKTRKTGIVTQDQLASTLNMTPRHLNHIETGARGLTVDNAIVLAEHFSVTLDYVYRGIDDSSNLHPICQLVFDTLDCIHDEDIKDFYVNTITNLSHLTMNM